jgi:RsiW-degrading membrane proteinase PrsW (M82 family)
VTPLALAAVVLAVVVSTVLLVAVVAAVWWFDRYDREPLHLVAGVFLWGGLAAPVLSVIIRSVLTAGWAGQFDSLSVWSGSLVEEAAKAVGIVLVVLLSREFDNPTDGLVYGTACGLGFAATENLVYTVAGIESAAVTGTLMLVLLRTTLAAGIHAVSSAALGGCLGFGYLARNRAERVGWSFAGLAGAVAIHGGWNLTLLHIAGPEPEIGPAWWIVAVPLLYGFYLTALWLFLKSEQRILSRELTEEVELDVFPKWIVDVMPYYRRRIRSDWWPSRRERTVLSRLLTRLAFRKHAVRRLPEAEADLAGLEVVQLRHRIRSMLSNPEE